VKTNHVDLFGPLLHGTARAWRLKLDQRLKPMGLSQAKWRTLMHLSVAPGPMTQAEIASHLGIEEPTLVTLLHRLEGERWVARRNRASRVGVFSFSSSSPHLQSHGHFNVALRRRSLPNRQCVRYWSRK